ncbi:MAG: DUF192 domain-containing protein [Bacteroidetes bacterium]|nr:DUF192 domain-containing protein [Bacteroidota bacterium]
MQKRWIAVAILALTLQSYSCKDQQTTKVLTKEVTFTKEGDLKLLKSETDSVIATLDVEFAISSYETQTGLMYRKGMKDTQGMLFVFSEASMKSFYMKNTQFPLDIIYINDDLEVINIVKNAQPYNESSLPSQAPARYVLEVNAGLSDRWGLAPTDKINYTKLDQ